MTGSCSTPSLRSAWVWTSIATSSETFTPGNLQVELRRWRPTGWGLKLAAQAFGAIVSAVQPPSRERVGDLGAVRVEAEAVAAIPIVWPVTGGAVAGAATTAVRSPPGRPARARGGPRAETPRCHGRPRGVDRDRLGQLVQAVGTIALTATIARASSIAQERAKATIPAGARSGHRDLIVTVRVAVRGVPTIGVNVIDTRTLHARMLAQQLARGRVRQKRERRRRAARSAPAARCRRSCRPWSPARGTCPPTAPAATA